MKTMKNKTAMKQTPDPVMDNEDLEGTGMRWTNTEADNTRRRDLQGRTPAQYRATAQALGWTWIAMAVMLVIMLIGTCSTVNAQTVYETRYKNQADLLVYEVDYPSQADFRYYVVEYRSQANEQKHHWYYVQYPAQAEYTIYWVEYASQADSLVYEAKYPSQTL
jgi:hypothetical protein